MVGIHRKGPKALEGMSPNSTAFKPNLPSEPECIAPDKERPIVRPMSERDLAHGVSRDGDNLRLSDYIRNATALESEQNSDGSTTIYLRLHRRERYSTLPRSRRRPWFVQLFGGRSARVGDPDPLGVAANVRKVPRRTSDLV